VLRALALACLLAAPAAGCRGSSTAPAPTSATPDPQALKPKEKSMFFGQPVVSVKLEFFDCVYRLYINGGHVATDRSAMPLHEEQPINQWLRSGVNEIELHLFKQPVEGVPPDRYTLGEATRATVALTVKPASRPDDPGTQIASLAYSLAAREPDRTASSSPAGRFDSTRNLARHDSGDVEVGPVQVAELPRGVGIILKRTVKIPLPFRPWAFFRSEKMIHPLEQKPEYTQKLYGELLGAYEVVWKGLAGKDLDRVISLFEERSREIDEAYYKPTGSTQQRLREMLQESMNDRSLALAPIRGSKGGYWDMDVGPPGTLLGLMRGDRGSAIIRFADKDPDGITSMVFPIFFRREHGQYIITR
jgi:hypothetical protein